MALISGLAVPSRWFKQTAERQTDMTCGKWEHNLRVLPKLWLQPEIRFLRFPENILSLASARNRLCVWNSTFYLAHGCINSCETGEGVSGWVGARNPTLKCCQAPKEEIGGWVEKEEGATGWGGDTEVHREEGWEAAKMCVYSLHVDEYQR